MFDRLPRELIYEICKHCPAKSLIALSSTCKKYLEMCRNPQLLQMISPVSNKVGKINQVFIDRYGTFNNVSVIYCTNCSRIGKYSDDKYPMCYETCYYCNVQDCELTMKSLRLKKIERFRDAGLSICDSCILIQPVIYHESRDRYIGEKKVVEECSRDQKCCSCDSDDSSWSLDSSSSSASCDGYVKIKDLDGGVTYEIPCVDLEEEKDEEEKEEKDEKN